MEYATDALAELTRNAQSPQLKLYIELALVQFQHCHCMISGSTCINQEEDETNVLRTSCITPLQAFIKTGNLIYTQGKKKKKRKNPSLN